MGDGPQPTRRHDLRKQLAEIQAELERLERESPNRLERRNHGKGHSYRIDGRKALGVTTVLNTLPKPALVNWAARQSAENAINDWDELATLPITERMDRIQWAHRDYTRAAALRGTQIHDLGERVAHGEDVDVPDAHIGPVEAYARFLDEWQIEPVASETPVGHADFGYAGTADLWAHVGRRDNEYALIDLKTGKGVYDEVSLQLTAYRFAQLWHRTTPTPAERKNGVVPLEEPLPPVDAVYVAHIGADAVRMLPVETNQALLTQFRYLIQTHLWMDRCKDEPPVGQQIHPEG